MVEMKALRRIINITIATSIVIIFTSQIIRSKENETHLLTCKKAIEALTKNPAKLKIEKEITYVKFTVELFPLWLCNEGIAEYIDDIIYRREEELKEFNKDGETVKLAKEAKNRKLQWSENIKITQKHYNNNAVSLLIEIYSYLGGAHGNTSRINILWDLNNQKPIALDDIFVVKTPYLKYISEYSRIMIHEQKKQRLKDYYNYEEQNNEYVIPGTEPTKENFSIFYLTPSATSKSKGITIIFPEYHMGSYAEGAYIVDIPVKIFYPYLKQKYKSLFVDVKSKL